MRACASSEHLPEHLSWCTGCKQQDRSHGWGKSSNVTILLRLKTHFKRTLVEIKIGNLQTQAHCHHKILKLNHWHNMFMLRIMTNGLASLISAIITIKMISLVTYPVGSPPPLAEANESPSPTGGDNHHHPLYLLLSSWTLCTFWTM